MDVMREKWTDERLDDLRDHMDEGFAVHREALRDGLRDVRVEIRDVRVEIAGLRSGTKADIAGLRTELKGDIAGLRGETNARFDAMERLILRAGAGLVGTMGFGFLSLLLTQ